MKAGAGQRFTREGSVRFEEKAAKDCWGHMDVRGERMKSILKMPEEEQPEN